MTMNIYYFCTWILIIAFPQVIFQMHAHLTFCCIKSILYVQITLIRLFHGLYPAPFDMISVVFLGSQYRRDNTVISLYFFYLSSRLHAKIIFFKEEFILEKVVEKYNLKFKYFIGFFDQKVKNLEREKRDKKRELNGRMSIDSWISGRERGKN